MTQRTPHILPGVVKDRSSLASARNVGGTARYVDSDRIRFRGNYPEKIGGWTKFVPNPFTGMCRSLLAWQDAADVVWLAAGTHQKLQATRADEFSDITPIDTTGTLDPNPFTTVAGGMTVIVFHLAHGRSLGDYVRFSGATAVGGLTIAGEYVVSGIIDSSNYTFEAATQATSDAVGGGGAVVWTYPIPVGRADAVRGRGYGIGGYGEGTWGTPRDTYLILALRTWALDNWGQDLLAMPRDGNLYLWQRVLATPAQLVANAPTNNTSFFVTPEKIVVVLGAGGEHMRVQWGDQDNLTEWTVSDQTTAGSRVLIGGNHLHAGHPTKGTNLILGDALVATMTFIGFPDVYGFDNDVGGASPAAGSVGIHASVEAGGRVFWMGHGDFYMYDGTVKPIPNSSDIRSYVFENLTHEQSDKVICGVNSKFTEIWWFLPFESENDHYVKVNVSNWAWDVGTVARTALIDLGVYPNPLMAAPNGYVYQHEDGYNDDGAPMNEFVLTGALPSAAWGYPNDTEIDFWSLFPDFDEIVGNVNVRLLTRTYALSPERERNYGPINAQTDAIDRRTYGKVARIKIDSTELDTFWRSGAHMFDISKGGQK